MSFYNANFRYRAVTVPYTPGATPQDLLTISGNDTTNVYVCKMGISSVQTADEFNTWYIAKRSTPNVGGTSVAVTKVPFNSNFPSASAGVVAYTTTPTPGTPVGLLWAGWLMSNDQSPANDVAGFSGIVIDFESQNQNPVALLSSDESIAWNFDGVGLPAGLEVAMWIEWYESFKA